MADPNREQNVTNTAGLAYFDVEEIRIAAWHPLPDGRGEPTQVHMMIRIAGFPTPFVTRFLGPRSLDRIIEALRENRAAVWPIPAPEET